MQPQPQFPVFSLPVPNFEGLDDTQRAAAQAMMPILPALVDQVVQIVNVSKANSDSANDKKVTKQVKENPEERKFFLVSHVFYGVDYLCSLSE